MGDKLDPEQITSILKCLPTRSQIQIPKSGHWALSINSNDYKSGEIELEEGIKILLRKLPSDAKLWRSLTTKYDVDIMCGLFLETSNRGFETLPKSLQDVVTPLPQNRVRRVFRSSGSAPVAPTVLAKTLD